MKKVLSFIALLSILLSAVLCSCIHKHDYDIKITKLATSTENGIKTYTCKICGDTYSEEYVPSDAEKIALRSKEAFEKSKEAYDKVNEAYATVSNFGSDVYNAWKEGIYSEDKMTLSYLAGETSLSLEDLKAGFVYYHNEEKWETMSEAEKKSLMNDAESTFKLYVKYGYNSVFSACVGIVSGAYEATGKTRDTQALLDDAKTIMKELSANYSDYEHYPSLKGYYTNAVSYFEFCKDPEGTFEQVKTTIEEYRNKARNFEGDLNYIFEE